MAKQTTRQEINREKQKVWTSRIKEWKSSGLTQVEFCRQEDLSTCQFTYWKCKLDKKEAAVKFVSLSGKALQPQLPCNSQAHIKLIFDSKYQIEIEDGFSPLTLSNLIRTLERL